MSQLIPDISIMAGVRDYFRYPALLLSLIGSIRIEQLEHGLLEDGAWATYIETHETTPCRMCVMQGRVGIGGSVEDLPIVEGQMSFVDEEVLQLVVIQRQGSAIEPYQERCLWSDGLDGWYVLFEKFDAKLADARHFSTSPCVI